MSLLKDINFHFETFLSGPFLLKVFSHNYDLTSCEI